MRLGTEMSAVGVTAGKEMETMVAELRETQGSAETLRLLRHLPAPPRVLQRVAFAALQQLMEGRAALQTQMHENDMVKAVSARPSAGLGRSAYRCQHPPAVCVTGVQAAGG